MVYIAGLHIPLPLSFNQGLEAVATVASLTSILYFSNAITYTDVLNLTYLLAPTLRQALKMSEEESGPIVPLEGYLSRVTSPVHGGALFAPMIIYLGAVLSNKLNQPGWYQAISLPKSFDEVVGVTGKTWLRTAASGSVFALIVLGATTIKALTPSFHFIGVRYHRLLAP